MTYHLWGEMPDGVRVGINPGESGRGWSICIEHPPEERELDTREAVEQFLTARFGAEFCRGMLASGLPEHDR